MKDKPIGIGTDVFLAKSGVWWAVHPVRRNRVFSLHTRDAVKARVKYAEIVDTYARAMKE
jgi:hypothetical protein